MAYVALARVILMVCETACVEEGLRTTAMCGPCGSWQTPAAQAWLRRGIPTYIFTNSRVGYRMVEAGDADLETA